MMVGVTRAWTGPTWPGCHWAPPGSHVTGVTDVTGEAGDQDAGDSEGHGLVSGPGHSTHLQSWVRSSSF